MSDGVHAHVGRYMHGTSALVPHVRLPSWLARTQQQGRGPEQIIIHDTLIQSALEHTPRVYADHHRIRRCKGSF
jgi:hypothetical protein